MSEVPVLLEARFQGDWCAIRIVRQTTVRRALDSLPMFAKQQKVMLDDVRARALRSNGEVLAAENAIIARLQEFDDPRR